MEGAPGSVETISADELLLRFGINEEEALQEVQFMGRVSTMAAMLLNDQCPVGAAVEQAHAEGGIVAANEKLTELAAALPGSNSPEISKKTESDYELARDRVGEGVKKN